MSFGIHMCNQTASSLSKYATQHSVHPTGGSRRVFRQFSWLEVGSVKAAFSRPAHQRVTQAVEQTDCKKPIQK
jgi:hypothetical protein